MADSDKNLSETVQEVLKKTQTSTETEKELSKPSETETKSGETVNEKPEYFSGVDISGIPEQDRPRIKELLTEKFTLLEKGYQDKFKSVAKLKQVQEEIQQLGLEPDEIENVLKAHSETKKNPKVTKSEKQKALKTFDELIDNAPPESKEALKTLRKAIKEETNSEEFDNLKKELDTVKKTLLGVSTHSMEIRTKERETEINSLKSLYGEELVDKYHDKILTAGLRYTDPARNILHAIVPPDELEKAIVSQKFQGKQPVTTEKKNAITSTGSGITSSKEHLKTDQPWKGLIRGLISPAQ